VSDFFEDTEEYDKIVSTVEDEIAQLQEGGRGRPSQPPTLPPATPVSVSTTEAVAVPEPEQPATSLQPLPGEMLSEERHEAPPLGPGGPVVSTGPAAHDDYDRRGGRGRRDRDRDRRGKKPKIPSFESKSFEREVRPEGRPYTLEALPGESLAKLSR